MSGPRPAARGGASPTGLSTARVVIVQYGPPEPCERCIASLLRSRSVRIELVVVDTNPASSSRLSERTRALGGAYVSLPENPGFASAFRRGLEEARLPGTPAAYILLNPDVRLSRGCIGALLEALAVRPRAGLVQPGLLDLSSPRCWWNAGGVIEWPSGRPRSRLHGERAIGRPGGVERTDFACGSVLAIRPELLAGIGSLREDYFLYFEDADYSYEARRAGWEVLVSLSALAWHEGGGSSEAGDPRLAYYRARNRLLFSKRWNPFALRGFLARGAFALRGLARACAQPWGWGRGGGAFQATAILDYWRGRKGRRWGDGGVQKRPG